MYEMACDNYPTTRTLIYVEVGDVEHVITFVIYIYILVSTKFHYFKIVPPASPYIIIPPGGIIIYYI